MRLKKELLLAQFTQVVTGQAGELLEVRLRPGRLPHLVPVTSYLPPVGLELWTLMPNLQAVLVSQISSKKPRKYSGPGAPQGLYKLRVPKLSIYPEV